MRSQLCGLILLTVFHAAAGLAAPTASAWGRTVVTIEASRKQYDQLQPWNQRLETVVKSGIVVNDQHILTTADFLNDTTLVRIQKQGRGAWYQASLVWIDYHANLALLSSKEPSLWADSKPAAFKEPVPAQGTVEILRWRNGRLETTKGEIARLVVKRGKLSWVEHLQLEVQSEINAAGWSEIVVMNSRVVGLATSQEGNALTVLPASFFQPLLKAQRNGRYPGLGFFDFVWQKSDNPVTLSYLKLAPPPRGVVIIEANTKLGSQGPLLPKDVLLRIDGFEVDSEGDYTDPTYGKLSLENLAGRRMAGGAMPVEIWRDGKSMTVNYVLPRADYYHDLVPQATYDQPPEYLIVGGLVFQPLTEPFLRSWGTDWRRKAPFRLVYYLTESPTAERPGRILISAVLPDPFTIGYQDYRFLMVDKVNNKPVSRLTDIAEALKSPQGQFHIIDFAAGEFVRRVVIDAEQSGPATQRVLKRFGIEKDRQLSGPGPGN
jgi:hypothetical protein